MNIKQSSAALKAVDGFLKSRGVHLGAVSTLELVELMVVALATQPPQDERGQGRIPFAGHDPKFCPGSNPDNPQTEEDAEPAQPVALSTLTDESILSVFLKHAEIFHASDSPDWLYARDGDGNSASIRASEIVRAIRGTIKELS